MDKTIMHAEHVCNSVAPLVHPALLDLNGVTREVVDAQARHIHMPSPQCMMLASSKYVCPLQYPPAASTAHTVATSASAASACATIATNLGHVEPYICNQ